MFCSGKKSKMATALLRHQSTRDHRFEDDMRLLSELQYVWNPEKLIERDTHVRHGIHSLQMTPLCLSDNALAESYSYKLMHLLQ